MSTSTPPISLQTILQLFPTYLQRRRRGYGGIPALLAETGLSRPALFLLLTVAERGSAGGTVATLRPGAPYSTVDTHLPYLMEAVKTPYLHHDSDDHYRLTQAGLALITQLETEIAHYLATLQPIPAADLDQLAAMLATIAAGLDREAGGPHAHIHYADNIAALTPTLHDHPMVRVERAIFRLWMARDDAHIGASRIAHFDAPQVSILTQLWYETSESVAELNQRLGGIHTLETVQELVDELIMQGYVTWKAGGLQLARAGYNIRESIEADTDDLYFRQWPSLDATQRIWLYTTLNTLINALPPGTAAQS